MSHHGIGLSSVIMWNQRYKFRLFHYLPLFKVREMMAKEGVVLDFSDTKLKGWHPFTTNVN